MMRLSWSLTGKVGLASAVFFVVFAIILSQVVSGIVTSNFEKQTKESVANFLETQVNNFLNPEDFEHRMRSEEEIRSEREVFGPFVEAIETEEVVRIRIWDDQARIIHAHDGGDGRMMVEEVNQSYPDNGEYWRAMEGVVTAHVGVPLGDEEEGLGEVGQIMEVYVPVYLSGRESPVGVAEIYYSMDELNKQIAVINRNILLMTGATFALLYFVLLLITMRASETIEKQTLIIEEAQEKEIESKEEFNEILRLLNKILRHDLLNSLTVVEGNIDTYFEYGEKKVDVKQVLKDVQSSTKRGMEVIAQMKELETALATGKELEEVRIEEIAKKAAEEFPEIKIEVRGKGVVKADAALTSVLTNLYRNAVVHGGTKRIEVTIAETKERVVVKVGDEGKGIPDEVKEKLFAEGFKYGETGHTGLGLYIVKKTVERYKGEVGVEDNRPKGAVFVIRLPINS